MVYCICAGNHEIEQQNGVLSNYLVSYRSRFKVTSRTAVHFKLPRLRLVLAIRGQSCFRSVAKL